jgi:hypothetical protein
MFLLIMPFQKFGGHEQDLGQRTGCWSAGNEFLTQTAKLFKIGTFGNDSDTFVNIRQPILSE